MKTMTKGCAWLFAILLVSGSQGAGSDEESRILSVENAWNQAEVAHDAHALEPLLAETFVYTDDDGSFMNRVQWLSHIARGDDHYQQLASEGVAVQVYGTAAVVTGVYREKIEIKGKVAALRGRFTDMWIKKGSQWKCVASQSTLIKN